MKIYTVSFKITAGNDEFWEGDPTPSEVLESIEAEFGVTSFDVDLVPGSFRIVKIEDDTEYEKDD